MLEGTLIQSSLKDASILNGLDIVKTWTDEDWLLHHVAVSREEAIALGKSLNDGPWYMHFWEKGKDEILVVFKDAFFDIKQSDKTTWEDAIKHGRSLGIPDKQLDFVTD